MAKGLKEVLIGLMAVRLGKLSRWIESFSARMCWVSGSLLLAVMLITVADVILRRWFSYPIKGSFEIIQFLMGISISLAIAYTQTQKGHIAIEVIQFSGLLENLLDNIGRLISIAVFSLFSWQLCVLGLDYWRYGQVSDTLGIPVYPFMWGLSFGCALMVLVLLIELINSIFVTEQKK